MNKFSTERRCAGNSPPTGGRSVRSTVRITGVSKNAATKLQVDLGEVCLDFQR